MPDQSPPRLLLVEDDVVSRAFLREALAMLPAQVDAAEDIASATAFVSMHTYSLFLVDANLPDGNGTDCLRVLRHHQAGVPALAITAEAHRDGFDTLCSAGFIEVLQKPISVAALQAGVSRALGLAGGVVADTIGEKQPAWDEQQALAAVAGNRGTLAILRQLFLSELPSQRDRILANCECGHAEAARAELHKLKASCGFVGAARLLGTVQRLSDSPLDTGCIGAFTHAVNDTLAAQA